MKETRMIMGMPVTLAITGEGGEEIFRRVFSYFIEVDQTFSTYKKSSEISRINRGEIPPESYSAEMKTILALADETKKATQGYFDITDQQGNLDPSGLVKGWAISEAAKIVREAGFENFYVEAGGDIQAEGLNEEGRPWTVGIKNPFNEQEIVKVLSIRNRGVATSGTYIRGQHIYNPHSRSNPISDIVSLTVIAPDVYEADRFATAAFAMGADGINFLQQREELEGYMIDRHGVATATSGFNRYLRKNA